MSDAGKGDKSRVRDHERYRANYDRIFNRHPLDMLPPRLPCSRCGTLVQIQSEDCPVCHGRSPFKPPAPGERLR